MAEQETNVIVAIPSLIDPVWKISSEKIPHMTLLYLEDLSTDPALSDVMQFLQHAVQTSLSPFWMEVDHRGTLGADDADVLFFGSPDGPDPLYGRNREIKKLAQFRQQLLQNPSIAQAYNAVQQFPQWTPHLTLGYPTAPAKELDRDYGISMVEFDKIAIWTSDFDGVDFQLSPSRDLEVSMSDVVSDILAHHGVKGQKWGVRHDPGHVGERAKTKTIVKADKKFEKEVTNANNQKVTMAYHNAAVRRINARVDALNDSPKYRDIDLSTYKGKVKADYEKDSQEAILSSIEDATREIYGSNASGTKKAVYNRETDRVDIVDIAGTIEHAASPVKTKAPDVSVQLKRNPKTGLIASVDVKPLVSSVKHDDLVGNILAHHGVKGMKWGVRKDGSTSSTTTTTSRLARKATDITVKQKPGQFVRTTGGKKQVASEDAVRVAAARQLAKKSTTDALSNKQLQEAVTRMNLEQQYSQLAKKSDRRTAGQKIVQSLLGQNKNTKANDQNVVQTAKDVAGVIKIVKTAAATAA